MKFIKLTLTICLILNLSSKLYSQEPTVTTEKTQEEFEPVKLPVNVWDTYTFNESYAPYIKKFVYASGPVFMVTYGFLVWNWGSEDFTLKPETYKGAHATNGAADKWGHAYANYAGMRFFTFLFRATGSSRTRAGIEGAILMEITSLGGEIGDGFSHDYGFDPYDVLFNQFGIILGLILNWSPVLDRMFTARWEYFPSKRVRSHIGESDKWDVSTDYNDTKYIITTKLGGIPYVSRTPLRYFNIDVGYFSRGYRHTEESPSRTRNIYLGFSVNLTFVLGDLLPTGYVSSSFQSLFNYYNLPWDYEAKKWVLSDVPHEDFSD